MTNAQLWKMLDRNMGTSEREMMGLVDALKRAYDEDLDLICGCKRIAPDTYNQLYVAMGDGDGSKPLSRYMLCYTSFKIARRDSLLPEPAEALPARFVIENALTKPQIGGLLFNRCDERRSAMLPKFLLMDERDMLDGLASFMMSVDPSLMGGLF